MSGNIFPVSMPKWGMTMEEGKVTDWLISEGGAVNEGDEIVEIETDKISNVVESQTSGILVRHLVVEGSTYKVGSLIGGIIDGDVKEDEIDNFIKKFESEEKIKTELNKKDQERLEELYSLIDKRYDSTNYINQHSVLSKIEKSLESEILTEKIAQKSRPSLTLSNLRSELNYTLKQITEEFRVLRSQIIEQSGKMLQEDSSNNASNEIRRLRKGGIDPLDIPAFLKKQAYEEDVNEEEIPMQDADPGVMKSVSMASSEMPAASRAEPSLNLELNNLKADIERIQEYLRQMEQLYLKEFRGMREDLNRINEIEVKMETIERSLKKIIENQEFELEAARKLMGLKMPPKKKY